MKHILATSIVALTLTSFALSASAAEAKKPNILLIVADDLGYGELGFQGNKEIPTPHLDSLAQNGVRFTNGYVSGPYCSPTRAALLTGRYQQRFGHEFNPGKAEGTKTIGLSLEERTIADRLKAAGYVTGMFGKWHLGNAPEFHPLKRGFDEYYGFLGGAHTYLGVGAAQNVIQRGTKPEKEIDFTTAAFARETVRFIEQNKEKPWFVYLPFNAVHGPLEAPQSYLEKFAHIADEKRRTYAAMESALDDAVGTVLAKLAELKLEENTLIVFFTDNGGPTRVNTSSNGPLSGFKAQVLEGGVRVPFVVQWKGKLPAGKVYDAPVIQLDVQPTVLAAAGVASDAAAKFDGVNLLPYLTGEKTDAPHSTLFWRFGQQRAVRSGDWKLTDTGGGAKLFNLTNDIGEQKDLAAEQPEKLKELETAYADWNKGNVPPAWVPGNPERFSQDAADKPARGGRKQRRQEKGKADAPAAQPATEA
jgi:arylsulfatase A-like enzyme